MRKVLEMANRFRREEDGAAMVEYSILIGIITASVIAIIVTVGLWVEGQWTELRDELQGQGAPPAT